MLFRFPTVISFRTPRVPEYRAVVMLSVLQRAQACPAVPPLLQSKRNCTPTLHLLDLPAELGEKILGYLDYKSLSALAAVSQVLHQQTVSFKPTSKGLWSCHVLYDFPRLH